jgi:hypothetical protein
MPGWHKHWHKGCWGRVTDCPYILCHATQGWKRGQVEAVNNARGQPAPLSAAAFAGCILSNSQSAPACFQMSVALQLLPNTKLVTLTPLTN